MEISLVIPAFNEEKYIGACLDSVLRSAKGKLKEGDTFIHESIIGSKFTGRVEKITKVGDKLAIIPSVEGWVRIYGYNTISINKEDDPYAFGFQVI